MEVGGGDSLGTRGHQGRKKPCLVGWEIERVKRWSGKKSLAGRRQKSRPVVRAQGKACGAGEWCVWRVSPRR